jgi:acyl-CoA synthetase (AMP-forming)/AMP-acid ligase II/acyl carrier protein
VIETIVDCLEERAARHGRELAYRYLETGDVGSAAVELDNRTLHARVLGVAAELGRSLAPGDRALLLYPPGLDFVVGFYACLAAGVIAVPAFPPDATALDRSLGRLRAIAADCGARAVLTTRPLLDLASALGPAAPELLALRWIASDEVPAEEGAGRRRLDRTATAFLQYTSGSTGTPKGVVVGHDNLLHNLAVIARVTTCQPGAHSVSWLPLYHDMGLIGCVLGPVYLGLGCSLMSPLSFLERPARWLEMISAYRATLSAAPNFAYELCVRRIGPDGRARLDLSSWELSFNGAEPVRAATLERFQASFAPCGLRPRVVRPVYGLAESTLIVSGAPWQAPVTTLCADSAALEQGRIAPAEGDAPARALVGCGRPALGQRVEIVDPVARRRAGPLAIGEIWLAGPSVARGYWQRPEDTARDFQARLDEGHEGPFLRTGDLGFVHDGELFVTGRLKDLIIVRGRNLYPHDLELAAERAHASVRPGGVVAFGADEGGEEGVVILAEVDGRRALDAPAVIAAIRAAVAAEVGAGPAAVALLQARTLPKTTSGKVQRRAARALFLGGGLALAAAIDRVAPQALDVAAAVTRVLAAGSPGEREAALVELTAAEIGALLGPLAAAALTPDTPLHALGLDSLGRVDLVTALGAALGLSLPASLAFTLATPRALARALAARLADGAAGAVSTAPTRADATAAAPLLAPGRSHRPTENQALMWRLQQHAPGAYMHLFALEVRGDLGVTRLRAALQAVVDGAAAFRTTFHRGEPGCALVARVHPTLPVTVEVVDGAAWTEAELEMRVVLESRRGIDPAVGPLLRGTLVRRGPDTSVILLAANHLAYDSATLLRALSAIVARLGGQAPPATDSEALPATDSEAPPATDGEDFARYAAWEEANLASPEGERLATYWRRTLPRHALRGDPGRDRPEGAPRSYDCAVVSADAPAGLPARLEAVARARALTMNTVLVTAFQAALHRATGRLAIVVGTAALTRLHPEHRRIAGPLFNHLPLVAHFDEDLSWDDLLARGQQAASEALAHQDHPFGRLAAELGVDRNALGDAVFTLPAMCAYYRAAELGAVGPLATLAAGGEARLGDLSVRLRPVRTGTSATDYFLFATELHGALRFDLWYACELIDPARAERLLAGVLASLTELADDPARPVSRRPS